MALRIERATDVQRGSFAGLREKHREPGEVLDWFYDEKTTCLILEGKAVVDHYGERIPVEAGDLVTFPQGFHCQWEVLEPLRVVGKAAE